MWPARTVHCTRDVFEISRVTSNLAFGDRSIACRRLGSLDGRPCRQRLHPRCFVWCSWLWALGKHLPPCAAFRKLTLAPLSGDVQPLLAVAEKWAASRRAPRSANTETIEDVRVPFPFADRALEVVLATHQRLHLSLESHRSLVDPRATSRCSADSSSTYSYLSVSWFRFRCAPFDRTASGAQCRPKTDLVTSNTQSQPERKKKKRRAGIWKPKQGAWSELTA
jgi:hypothetical protein